MLGKVKKLFKVIYYFFVDNDNLLLYLMQIKAYEILNKCQRLSIGNTEELEDLIFHIKTYLEIPQALIEFKYIEFRDINIKKVLKKYKKKKLGKEETIKFTDYILEVEKQRAIERDFIFESAKVLNFGFEF